MASNGATEEVSARPGHSPRGPGSGGRGRGRGRGRGNIIPDSHGGDSRTPNRRGRGGHGGSSGKPATESNTMTAADLSSQFAPPLTESREIEKEKARKASVAASEVEAEVCFICASPVEHNSVAPCNHRTCHICALRMRALYKTKDCAHCRVSKTLLRLSQLLGTN